MRHLVESHDIGLRAFEVPVLVAVPTVQPPVIGGTGGSGRRAQLPDDLVLDLKTYLLEFLYGVIVGLGLLCFHHFGIRLGILVKQ
jgi:hypothetical protein